MPRISLLLGLAAITLLLGACQRVDPDEARVCRVAVVALTDADPAPRITRQSAIASEGAHDIRIDYEATNPGRAGFVLCRFAPSGRAGPPEPIAVAVDGRLLSDVQLYILKRFWLATPDADTADPQPVALPIFRPVLAERTAYGLQQALNALPAAAIYGLLAAAYSLVYGLIGRINLAFGEMAAIGGAGALAGAAFAHQENGWALVVMAVLGGAWAAAWHGFAIARAVFLPLRRTTGQQGLVATVGLALVLNEYLRLACGPAPAYIAPLRTAPIAVARSTTFTATVTPIGLAIAAAALATAAAVLILLKHTQFGRNWRAMADDAGAARLMGIDGTRVFAQTFLLASTLAGLAGATVVLVYGSFGTTLGATLGLKALLAAVMGGIGSVPGAFLGGLALGILEAGWSAYYSIDTRDLATFVVLAAALVLRPGGLFGYADLAPRRV